MIIDTDFQTPDYICDYMVSLLPDGVNTVFEPTPGQGNIVKSLEDKGYMVDYPSGDFFDHPIKKYDAIVMNPPFTPMTKGYTILYECMERSNIIIALMPWLTLINSERRTKYITNYGLHSITHLPRSVFKGSRVQTCIMKMIKGYNSSTLWKNYEKDNFSNFFS